MVSHRLIIPNAGIQPFELPGETLQLPAEMAHWKERISERIELNETSRSTPSELAYARALGIPDTQGKIPWAAYGDDGEPQKLGSACAWVYPCHLAVGMTDMVLQPIEDLHLTEAQSRELLALIAPYFEQDGLVLRYHSPLRWLAQGALFEDFEYVSLSRAQGRGIGAFLPAPGTHPKQLTVSRLQAQVQMLLYTHPFNAQRQSRGLPVVNSFWVDGAGVLQAMAKPSQRIQRLTCLQEAAGSAAAYSNAWQHLRLQLAQQTAQAFASAQELSVTWCGEKAAITLCVSKPNWKDRYAHLLLRKPLRNLRQQL
jgi:hypothetical protein